MMCCHRLSADNQRLTGLCVAFFTLFFSFFAAQNQVAPTLQDAGTASLSLLYATFALTSMVTPSLLTLFAQRPDSLQAETRALILGSALYAPFLVACSFGPSSTLLWLQLATSAVLGGGAGLLWVSQGSLLTASTTPSNRGRWSGLFWSSFMSGNACGNFATAFVLHKMSISNVFLSFAGLTLVSSCLFWALVRPRTMGKEGEGRHLLATAAGDGGDDSGDNGRVVCHGPSTISSAAGDGGNDSGDNGTRVMGHGPSTTSSTSPSPPPPTAPPSSLKQDLALLLRASCCIPQTRALIPLLLFIGCENSFWGGAFPEIIGAIHGKEAVALVLGVLATSDIVASLLSGMVLDLKLINTRVLLLSGLLLFASGSMLVWVERSEDERRRGHGGGANETVFDALSATTPSSSSSSSPSSAVSSMWLVYGAAVCMGLGDGICNTVAITRLQVLSVRWKLLSKRTAFQMFQCINVAMTSVTFVATTLTTVVVRGGKGDNVVWWLLESLVLLSMLGLCSKSTYQDDDE